VKKEKMAGAEFKSKLAGAMNETEELRSDEFQAVDKAHQEAHDATKHAARGAQTEVRDEARQVWSLSDHLARRSRSDQDLSEKLQNRAEVAADVAENEGEELARRTQDRLEENRGKAREDIRREADRRFEILHDLGRQSEALEEAQEKKAEAKSEAKEKKAEAKTEAKEKKAEAKSEAKSEATSVAKSASSNTFLAQNTEGVKSASYALAWVAVVGVSVACLMFFAKRNRRTVATPEGMLG